AYAITPLPAITSSLCVFPYRTIVLLPSTLPLPFFFFNDTATTEIYTLSLHDALPILDQVGLSSTLTGLPSLSNIGLATVPAHDRSEEHTSELQSRENLVCRLLLEKKKKKMTPMTRYSKQTAIQCSANRRQRSAENADS